MTPGQNARFQKMTGRRATLTITLADGSKGSRRFKL